MQHPPGKVLCIDGSALYIVGTAYPYDPYWRPSTQFLALFFFYLRFQCAIDKLYCVLCPSSGHVYPRKHTVPITSLLLRFSSLQARSTLVQLPCSVPASVAFPQGRLPSTLPIYVSSHLGFRVPEESRLFTSGFLFIFIFSARGPIGLYNGFVVKVCYFIAVYPHPISLGCCERLQWCSMPSHSAQVTRCTPITFPPSRRKRPRWL